MLVKPKPYGGQAPVLISAGASSRGRAFALRHADALFTAISNFDTLEEELRVARATVADGRRVPVYASGHLISKPTRKETDDYYHYLVYELGDWRGVDEVAEHRMRNRTIPYRSIQELKENVISGNGVFGVRGSYDEVVEKFARLHAMGLDGMAVSLIDYVGDFPMLRDEILPRLERLGLRHPVTA